MINYVSRKTMKNLRKHGDIKLVTTDENRSKWVWEPNYLQQNNFQRICWQQKLEEQK